MSLSYRRLIAGISAGLLIVSCSKDPVPDPIIPGNIEEGKHVLVLNEGNFQWGNASTTLINALSGEVTQNLFEKTNDRPLGDVLQSAYKGSELFLVVNNSQKIERMPDGMSRAGAPISGFQSPRYIVKSNHGYYVTDLYSNRLYKLSNSLSHAGQIPMNGWGEEMACADGESVFVCNVSNGFLMKLSASEDRFVDSVRLGDSPKSIVFDSSNRLWILCEGKIYPEETPGSLWCLNPEDLSVLYQADFAGGEHPARLNIRKQGADTLYFLKGGVYKMPLNNFQVPESPFIAENNRLFYGLGVDASGNIWVSDAKDYVQPGDVYLYSASGTEQAHYKAGIIPSGFVFY